MSTPQSFFLLKKETFNVNIHEDEDKTSLKKEEWANVTHHHESNFNFNLIQWLLFSLSCFKLSKIYTQSESHAHVILLMTFERCDESNVCKLMHGENCVNTTRRSRRLSYSENGIVKEMEMSWRQRSQNIENWVVRRGYEYMKQSSSMKFHFLLYFSLI